MYSSSESDSEVVTEDNEEGRLYQWIYEMTTEDKKGKEEVQIPTSSGNTPVDVETDAEARPSAVVANTKGLDVEALDNTPVIPAPKTEEGKPWRRADANISDYFNYGFNEESWNIYCKKQFKVQDANEKLHSKITVQRGLTTHEEEEESRPACPSFIAASRRSDVIGGQPAFDGRAEGRQRRRDGNNSQLSSTNQGPHLPPLLLHWTGVSSFVPSVASSAGLTGTGRARERYIRQGKCDRDRNRSRKHSHGDKARRGRRRHREGCPSSHSVEDRMKIRDTAEERGPKRHSDRPSAEEPQQGERKEGRRKPSGSSSRRDGGLDGDSPSKPKKKKAKKPQSQKTTKLEKPNKKERKSKRD